MIHTGALSGKICVRSYHSPGRNPISTKCESSDHLCCGEIEILTIQHIKMDWIYFQINKITDVCSTEYISIAQHIFITGG